MTLIEAADGKEYVIEKIDTDDNELVSFLSSLGCCSDESITVVSRSKSCLTVSIKDGRYSIDTALAAMIHVK